MNNKSALLNRRTFLRGTGVALALPWFETFAADSPRRDKTPKRFVSVYHPDGVGLPLKSDPALGRLELVSTRRRKRIQTDQGARCARAIAK